MRLGYKSLIAAGSVAAVLVIPACANTNDSTGSPATTAPAIAAGIGNCQPFQGTPPPNPTPAPTPNGAPDQVSSLTNLQTAVVAAAQSDQLSKQAHLCAEGSDPASLEACNKDYWQFGSFQPPGTAQSCNFFYLRVADDYWNKLTPMVLAEYGDYLAVGADGKDPANANAGPHSTIDIPGGAQVNYPAINLPVSGNALDGAAVAAAIQPLLTGKTGSSGSDRSTPIQPVLASDSMTINCTDQVWTRGPSPAPWKQTNISTVPIAAKSKFWCTANTKSQGTGYISVTLGTPTATSVPATAAINQGADQQTALREDPTGPFSTDNVVWPANLPEVQQQSPVNFTIPTGKACTDETGKTAASCLHLWVTQASPNTGTGPFTACKLWFTLELNSPGMTTVMKKYGLDASGKPHISLAKSASLSGADAATYCGRAAQLNSESGINPLGGTPPKTTLR